MKNYDFLIIGGGILGLSIAYSLIQRNSRLRICILEKEKNIAFHASGRNSGVLHAGFYYTADSLKAKFTKEGNARLRNFCEENSLAINLCGKLVVAMDENELTSLEILRKRGEANGIDLIEVDSEDVKEIDPNVKTFNKALYSPTTATVNPYHVCSSLSDILRKHGVEIITSAKYLHSSGNSAITTIGKINFGKLINSAGLYADKIANEYSLGHEYIMIPFKGVYLKSKTKSSILKTNVYPVPNLANPFLGVHFTITVDGYIKIGPTAIPAFWKENYKGFSNFSLSELVRILTVETKLFANDNFGFRNLALQEVKKYNRKHLLGLASKMVYNFDERVFDRWTVPGIRAQLLNRTTNTLEQDFIVRSTDNSVHILNAVSPAFTCSFPMSDWVVKEYCEV